jgi:hypothetical protein
MALDAEKKREVAQLLFVASHYLGRASAAEHDAVTRLGETKAIFPLTDEVDDTTRRHTVVGADLASAAIRLASIDDVLWASGTARPACVECQQYFRKKNPSPSTDLHHHPEWFHIMLRDAIAHNEPAQAPTRHPDDRYRDCQDYIQETTFGEAYSRLRKIENELTKIAHAHGIGPWR